VKLALVSTVEALSAALRARILLDGDLTPAPGCARPS